VIWRFLTRTSRSTASDTPWWQDADRLASAPDATELERLRAAVSPDAPPDEAEQQAEMLEGLDQVLALADANGLPVVETQHRVIGSDRCHLMTPVTLAAEQAIPGKLFLTDRRLVFAGGRARTWVWHRVREVTRAGRAVTVVVAGPADLVSLHCNSYGDAMLVRHLACRLTTRGRRAD
jgi:hypothetical protein